MGWTLTRTLTLTPNPNPNPNPKVACGDAHSVALTYGGRVLTWGRRRRGALGLPLAAGRVRVRARVGVRVGVRAGVRVRVRDKR